MYFEFSGCPNCAESQIIQMEEFSDERIMLNTGNQLAAYLYLCRECKIAFTSTTELTQHKLEHSGQGQNSIGQESNDKQNEIDLSGHEKNRSFADTPSTSTKTEVSKTTFSAHSPLPSGFEAFVRLTRVSTGEEPMDLSQHAPSHQAHRNSLEETTVLGSTDKLFAINGGAAAPQQRTTPPTHLVKNFKLPKKLKVLDLIKTANPTLLQNTLEMPLVIETPKSPVQQTLAKMISPDSVRMAANKANQNTSKFASNLGGTCSVAKQHAEKPHSAKRAHSTKSNASPNVAKTSPKNVDAAKSNISKTSAPKIELLYTPTLDEALNYFSVPMSPKIDVSQSTGSNTSLKLPKSPCLKSSKKSSCSKIEKRNRRGVKFSVSYHRCAYCPETFESESARKGHEDEHTFACAQCNTIWPSVKALQKHSYKKHGSVQGTEKVVATPRVTTAVPSMPSAKKEDAVQDSEICIICTKKIPTYRMTAHRRSSHTEVNPYFCRECQFTTANYAEMWYHKRCHSVNNPYKCTSCSASFTTSLMAKRHIQREHNETPPQKEDVDNTPAEKVNQRDVEENIEDDIETQKFECSVCSKKYTRKPQLARHMKSHAVATKITKLEKRFSEKYANTNQLNASNNEVTSDTCGSKQGPNKPLIRRTSKDTPCPVCGVSVPGISQLKLHCKIYHPECAAYKCAECPFSTARRGSLLSHKTVHKVLSVFKCAYCTASFSHLNKQQQHIAKLHPGLSSDPPEVTLAPRKANWHPEGYYRLLDQVPSPRKIVCRICEEPCKSRRILEDHFAQHHQDNMPYACSACPYEGISYGSLWQHEKMHSAQKQYKCEFCSASFATSNRMSRHVNDVHCQNKLFKPHVKAKSEKSKPDKTETVETELRETEVSETELEETSETEMSNFLEKKGTRRISDIRAVSNFSKKGKELGRKREMRNRYFPCTDCDEKFSLYFALKIHRRDMHTEKQP